MTTRSRCIWAAGDPLMEAYHDEEWGVPVRVPRALWEMLMLEGFQAGLSWSIVLRKRDAFRAAFKGFDPDAVARFTTKDVERLLANPSIIRARAWSIEHAWKLNPLARSNAHRHAPTLIPSTI